MVEISIPICLAIFTANLNINNGRYAATTLLILAVSSNADVERLSRIADASWITFDVLKKHVNLLKMVRGEGIFENWSRGYRYVLNAPMLEDGEFRLIPKMLLSRLAIIRALTGRSDRGFYFDNAR